jgi:hypothetical protein
MKRKNSAQPARFFLGANPRNSSEQFFVEDRIRALHAYVIGASGCGKSKMLEDWVLQSVLAGNGVALVDPKGDLFWDTLASLAMIDERFWPALAERLVLVDLADPGSRVGFNPLQPQHGTTAARQVQNVYTLLRKQWSFDGARMARMDWLLKRSLQTLVAADGTLADLPRLLSDRNFRAALLDRARDPELNHFWEEELPASDSARFQWISPVLTRAQSLLDDAVVRRMLGSKHGNLDLRRAMDEGLVILFNLSKGRLGEESARTLGGLITSSLELAAESRQQIWPAERRRRFEIFVDEFHGFMAASSLRELLAEGRGYGVALTVAHQSLGQLDPPLQAALLANTKVRACFRVNARDAEVIGKEFAVGGKLKSRELRFIKINRVPVPVWLHSNYYTTSEETRLHRDTLHRLRDREFALNLSETGETVVLRTVDVPHVDRVIAEDRIARLKELLRSISPQPAIAAPAPMMLLPRTASVTSAPARYNWSPPRSAPPRRPPRIVP